MTGPLVDESEGRLRLVVVIEDSLMPGILLDSEVLYADSGNLAFLQDLMQEVLDVWRELGYEHEGDDHDHPRNPV